MIIIKFVKLIKKILKVTYIYNMRIIKIFNN